MTSQKRAEIVRWIPPAITVISLVFGGGTLYECVQANTRAIQANARAIQANTEMIQELRIQRAARDVDLSNLKEKVDEIRADVKVLLRRGAP